MENSPGEIFPGKSVLQKEFWDAHCLGVLSSAVLTLELQGSPGTDGLHELAQLTDELPVAAHVFIVGSGSFCDYEEDTAAQALISVLIHIT